MKNVVRAALTLTALLSFQLPLFAASKNDLSEIKLSFRYNTLAEDSKNQITWKTSENTTRDRFDAESGASVSRATQSWAGISVVSKNKVLPKGLRALLLYAVSPRKAAIDDALTVTEDAQNPKQLTIHFVHRGIAYRIETDERGILDTDSSFYIADNVAENKAGIFTLVRSALPGGKQPKAEQNDPDMKETPPDMEQKPLNVEQSSLNMKESPLDMKETSPNIEQKPLDVKESSPNEKATDSAFEPAPFEGDATDMHNIVWENIDFVPDTASEKAPQYYAGRLRTSYNAGVLTITGTLVPQKPAPEASDSKK